MNKKQKKLVKALVIFSTLIIGVGVGVFFLLRKPEIEVIKNDEGECEIADFKELPEIFIKTTAMKDIIVKT
jgi:hypothetical protein